MSVWITVPTSKLGDLYFDNRVELKGQYNAVL